MENIVPQVGTRPGPLIAAYLSVRSERVRDWKRRGLIGPSCDVHSRQEGFEVTAVAVVARRLLRTRPRVELDETQWRSHAERVA